MRRFGAPAPLLLALAFAGLFFGGKSCMGDTAPELVRVLEVVPREVEVGDRISILGEGYPPGKPARVTFRGTLHRPGERPIRGAEIVVPGTVTAANRVELAVDEATQGLFAGAGDRATHTTFEGDVEVAFAAAAAGTAPIAGLLVHTTIDVRPSATVSEREREREGEHVLAWMGVRAVTRASGLVVDTVAVGSRAEGAGIAAGDLLTSFDGVRVASSADVLPFPGEAAATIGVRRLEEGMPATSLRRGPPGEPSETTHIVPMDGLHSAFSAELIDAALIVLAALGIVWLFGAPTNPLAAAALQRAVSRMRARAPTASKRAITRPLPGRGAWGLRRFRGAADTWRLIRTALAVARDALPPNGPTAVADAIPCALLVAMPFGQYAVAARLDVALLFVAAAASLATASFASGRSVWRGVCAAGQVAWQHVPAAAAVASVVVTTGSLRIHEIEHAQAGWPWEWIAFRSPASIVALALLLACARIEPDADPPAPRSKSTLVAVTEDGGGEGRERTLAPWRDAVCRVHRVIVAGLASVLFLGGWLLPGLTAAEQDARPALEIAGAVCLLVKTGCLVVVMAWIRWALPRCSMGQRTRATVLWIGPLAATTLAATAAWTWWGPAPSAQVVVSMSLVGTAALAAMALAHRLRHGLMSALGDVHLTPFL